MEYLIDYCYYKFIIRDIGGNEMKKSILLTIVATGLLLGGCSEKKEETVVSKPKTDLIKVSTDATFAPFEYIEDGEIVGFDADLLKEVMNEAGLKYELKNVGWEPLFELVKADNFQMGVSSITMTPDRLSSFDFSNPYFESSHLIMVPENSSLDSADDLKDLKKIGVQIGTTGQTAAEKVVGEKSSKIKKFDTTALAIIALKNGDVEAVVTDNTVANAYIEQNPGDGFKNIADTTIFEPEYYGYMVKKGNEELQTKLNEGLEKVIASGKYAEIYKNWFGSEPNLDALVSEK